MGILIGAMASFCRSWVETKATLEAWSGCQLEDFVDVSSLADGEDEKYTTLRWYTAGMDGGQNWS